MQKETEWKEKGSGNIRRRLNTDVRCQNKKRRNLRLMQVTAKKNAHLSCEVQEQYVIICGICLHLRLWNLNGNLFC